MLDLADTDSQRQQTAEVPNYEPRRSLKYLVFALAALNALAAIFCGVLNLICGDFCTYGPSGTSEALMGFGLIGILCSSAFVFVPAARYSGLRAQILSAAAVFAGQQIYSQVIDPLAVVCCLQFALLLVLAIVWRRRVEAWIYGGLFLLSPVFVWLTLSA